MEQGVRKLVLGGTMWSCALYISHIGVLTLYLPKENKIKNCKFRRIEKGLFWDNYCPVLFPFEITAFSASMLHCFIMMVLDKNRRLCWYCDAARNLLTFSVRLDNHAKIWSSQIFCPACFWSWSSICLLVFAELQRSSWVCHSVRPSTCGPWVVSLPSCSWAGRSTPERLSMTR